MSITYIGSTLSVVSGSPTTEDQSGYEALSWTEVGKVISVGELGDQSEDVSFDLLKTGRRTHVSGVKDVGEVPVSMEFDASDAGQTLLEAANNGNTTHSFKMTDTDGEDKYFQGVVANLTDTERNASSFKGRTCVLRGQTAITTVDGP